MYVWEKLEWLLQAICFVCVQKFTALFCNLKFQHCVTIAHNLIVILAMYIHSTFSHSILVRFVLILFSHLHLCLPSKILYEHFILPNDGKGDFFSFQVKRPEREYIDYIHVSHGCCLPPPAFHPRFDGENLIIQYFKVHILTLF